MNFQGVGLQETLMALGGMSIPVYLGAAFIPQVAEWMAHVLHSHAQALDAAKRMYAKTYAANRQENLSCPSVSMQTGTNTGLETSGMQESPPSWTAS